ncbi:hypothetical protein [Desulfotruncus alcoholivorax]|uniref:hypothetical protein n=1 Tax=Desulfotruncus alcoholivorax TaxID=265477 RepID=UPI00041E444F|nr:hypothetical protein [Desulfotruncus alcoholivorax]
MTRKQLSAAKLECRDSKCRYYYRCAIYWGQRCNRMGGSKIPRIKEVRLNYFNF